MRVALSGWIIALLLFFHFASSNFLNDVVAGVGIAGIAIGFALQSILNELFAYLCIYLDKPFKIGDFITVADDMGTVENIGIRSTRLRTLQGEILVLSNKELLSAKVHNYKEMESRRVISNIELSHNVTVTQLKKARDIIEETIASIENINCERVHFTKITKFGYSIELMYLVKTSDYNKHLDIQQQILLSILAQFEANNIKLAYIWDPILCNKNEVF